MAEWQCLYFVDNPITITDFEKIFIDGEDVSAKIDRIDVTFLGTDKGFEIMGYKDGDIVKLISEGKQVKEIVHCACPNYDTGKFYRVYNIELGNRRLVEKRYIET